MKIAGIVAEYNPFHNGHLYQLEQTKQQTECDFVIAVMSGNFTQRGIPSIASKYTRTKMALASGIDMVLELPFPYATASAERFCEASVSMLHKTGFSPTISFGSEHGSLPLLQQVADILLKEPPSISGSIQESLRTGLSFPRARVKAIASYLKNTIHVSLEEETICRLLSSPNNILGIHYLKAILKYNAPITPLTIKRKVAGYHDTTIYTDIASATAIREKLLEGKLDSIQNTMPEKAYTLFKDSFSKEKNLPELNYFSDLLQYKLSFSDKEDLYTLWDVPNSLLHSLIHASKKYFSISEIIAKATSKTYTKATVQRAILRILTDIKQTPMTALESVDFIPYIRVLGCKQSATKLLSMLNETSTVPIITNLGRQYDTLDPLSKLLLDYEERASQIYAISKGHCHSYEADKSAPIIIFNPSK